MRQIGHLNDGAMAREFGFFLASQGIENHVERQEDGTYGVWILSDDDLKTAEEFLRKYETDPKASEYSEGARREEERAALRQKEEKRSRRGTIHMRQRWMAFRAPLGPVTLSLIVVSVVVSLLTGLGSFEEYLQPLFITRFEIQGTTLRYLAHLPEILNGQVWRLVTPIFIHFGLLHLVFNMLWLRDLGSMVENRQGSLFLSLQVLLIAVVSNLVQYVVGGPSFGGMSGVVYGLVGYIWIRGRFDPASGLFLNPATVTMMIVWFFLCLVGLIGSVANGAHAAGLVMGMVWGYFSSGHLRRVFQ